MLDKHSVQSGGWNDILYSIRAGNSLFVVVVQVGRPQELMRKPIAARGGENRVGRRSTAPDRSLAVDRKGWSLRGEAPPPRFRISLKGKYHEGKERVVHTAMIVYMCCMVKCVVCTINQRTR